jgi:hypothetical protein
MVMRTAGGVARGNQNYRDALELVVAFQFTAHLKAVFSRHHHIEENHVRPLGKNHLFDSRGIMQPHGIIAFAFQQPVHQPDFRRRIVDDENFFQQGQHLPGFIQ